MVVEMVHYLVVEMVDMWADALVVEMVDMWADALVFLMDDKRDSTSVASSVGK